ncbi:MAG: tetratricopeptide repeat protein [Candidatus Jordarchaeum sp.]|uniref:tetratricopeptide repeat protein n=1 Tax=Candidatus Jordarchaeum sp. TaxID=2823881 RepID=UPI00404A9886
MAETVTFLVMGLPSEKLIKTIEYYIDWWPNKRYNVFFELFKNELKNVEKNTQKKVLNQLSDDVLSEVFSLGVKIFPIQDALLPSGETDFFFLERSVPETLSHAFLNISALYGELDDIKGLREAFRIAMKKFKEKLFSSLSSFGISEIMEELINIDPENYFIFYDSFERVEAGGAQIKKVEDRSDRFLEFTPSVVKSEPEIKKFLKWTSVDKIPGLGKSNQILYKSIYDIYEFSCFFEETEFYGLRAGNLKNNISKMFLPLNSNVIELFDDPDFRESLLEIEKIYLDQLMSQMAFDPDYFRFLTKEEKIKLILFLEHLKKDILHPLNTESKNEILAALAIIEGRILPSSHALNELYIAKPVTNHFLQFEYYLLLGNNLLLSGDLARSSDSIAEARSYAEEAEQTDFLTVQEALIKIRKGQLEEAVAELSNCYEKTGSPKIKGVSSYYTGMLYYMQGDFANAYRFFEEAQNWIQIREDLAAIHGRKGVCALKLEIYDEAFHEFKKLESLAKSNSHRELLAAAYEALGIIMYLTEKLDEAARYYGMALEIDQELNDDRSIADDYSNIGTIYYKKQRLDDALKYYERALETHRKTNEKRKLSIEYNNIGVTLRAKGNLSKALQYFQDALDINDEIENFEAVATNCNNIASVLSESGEGREALPYLERALSIAKELGKHSMVAEKYTDIGKILADENDFDLSLEYFEKALKIHKELDNKEEMIKDYSNIGLVLVNKGEIHKAVAHFEICLKISEELNYLKWLESTFPEIFKSYSFLKKKDPGKTFYFRVLEKFPKLAKQL